MDREPIFNVPIAVIWSLGLMLLVHAGLSLLSPERENAVIDLLAFNPARYGSNQLRDLGGMPAGLWSLVTHQFVHADTTHLMINSAWLLAFGGAVAQRIGSVRFVALALICGILGALLFLLFRFGEYAPMVGASGAVSGLMGGAFRFLFSAMDRGGFEAFRENPRAIPLMSFREMIRDRRVLIAVGIWLALNFLTGLAPSLLTSATGIAWEAHLGGFLFGILAFHYFDPPLPPRPSPEHSAIRPTLH